MKLEVWKFGGASLADGRAIAAAAERVAAHRGPLLVVASALAGVTDLLLQSTHQAGESFARKHQHAARTLLGRGRAFRELTSIIDQSAREYRDVCAAIDAIGHLGARGQDALVARGERVSAQLLAAAVSRASSAAPATSMPLDVMETDGEHGSATPKLEETTARARKVIAPLLKAGTIVDRPRLHRPLAGWQRRHARPRRLGSDRHGAGARAWARSGSCCGRTCRAFSPRIRASSPTRG